jgi:glutamate racemase
MLGLFDSGVGGLTILKDVIKALPDKAIVYYADNENCPLGEKTHDQIYKITQKAVEFLFNQGCNLVILACNTATSVAIRKLQDQWLPYNYPDKKILGIIRPVPESLLENKRNRSNLIAVMATPVTISQGFYKQELQDFGFTNILDIPCPGLALAIEKSDYVKINSLLKQIFENYSNQIPDIDDLVLACTHYPLIKTQIMSRLNELGAKKDIKIFDQGQIVSQKLVDYLRKHPQFVPEKGQVSLFCSLSSTEFTKNFELIMGFDLRATLI